MAVAAQLLRAVPVQILRGIILQIQNGGFQLRLDCRVGVFKGGGQ